MHVHILFPFKQSPWGGANQFLHALRHQLRQLGNYQNEPAKADILIANLNPGNLLPLLKQVSQIKSRHPDKITIARIDGPVSLIRDRNDRLDRLLFKFIDLFADGVIYQSRWSKIENNKIVQSKAPHDTVIHNAADPRIFYPESQRSGKHLVLKKKHQVLRRPLGSKIKLIATSWSPNIRKGFDIHQYLDHHLDFSRYSMTFIGNSPITFKNIKHIKPVSSQKLASFLRQHNIYITASQNDPCSNALIEAISCGLPAVALNSGGHPELIQRGGELFSDQNDIIPKIDLVAQNLISYQEKLPQFSIAKAANKYLSFTKQIFHNAQRGKYQPKHINLLTKIQTAKIKALHHL